jgi:hypothetical protein
VRPLHTNSAWTARIGAGAGVSSTDFIVQMLHKSGLLVALVSLVAHVSSYIMDDRNASISYSPSNLGGQYGDSQCYDGTLSVFFCTLRHSSLTVETQHGSGNLYVTHILISQTESHSYPPRTLTAPVASRYRRENTSSKSAHYTTDTDTSSGQCPQTSRCPKYSERKGALQP